MQFYLIMFFVYLVASGYWIRLMYSYKDNKVSIHSYFASLICVTCLDCAISFLEYNIYN